MNTKTLRTNPRFVLAAVAAVCFAGYAVGAHADEAIDGVQARTVHYADLNLKTAQGAEILYKRIRTAAGRVCGEGDAKELARIAMAKACVDEAVTAGVRAVGNPLVTDEYNAHFGAAQKAINLAALR
jgi:UrcA family protein